MKLKSTLKLLLIISFSAFAHAIIAQESTDKKSETEPDQHQPGAIATSNSVPDQIRADVIRAKRLKDFKGRLVKKTGFVFGSDYVILPQTFNESENGPTYSTGGIFRIYGHWAPSKKLTSEAGKIVFKIDHRHKIGSEVPTNILAPLAGVATSTAPVWNDKGWQLTNLYWTQGIGKKFAYRLGVVDATEYVDISILMNAYTEFSDISFSFNPTIPPPSQGLGALVRYSFTPNYYIMAGIADANSDSSHPQDFFETFGMGEYLSHVTIGWTTSYEERRENNANIVFWTENRKPDSDKEGGWGLAFNYSRRLQQWEPFFKAGFSDSGGTLLDRSVGAGVGYHFKERISKDFWAFAANWGRVPNSTRDQILFETYYRVQVFHLLQIAPHFHYFINPAFDPGRDNLYMLSFKVRFAI